MLASVNTGNISHTVIIANQHLYEFDIVINRIYFVHKNYDLNAKKRY